MSAVVVLSGEDVAVNPNLRPAVTHSGAEIRQRQSSDNPEGQGSSLGEQVKDRISVLFTVTVSLKGACCHLAIFNFHLEVAGIQ